MKTFIKVEDGKITDRIVVSNNATTEQFGPDFEDAVGDIGWIRGQNGFEDPPRPEPALDEVKQDALDRVKLIFKRRIQDSIGNVDSYEEAIVKLALNNVDKASLRILYSDFKTTLTSIRAAATASEVANALNNYIPAPIE